MAKDLAVVAGWYVAFVLAVEVLFACL